MPAIKQGGVKLNAKDALRIRERFAEGETLCSLTAEYKTHKDTIRNVLKHRTWKSAGGPLARKKLIDAKTAREIRFRYAAGGISMRALGGDYETTRTCIYNIVQFNTWAYAGGPFTAPRADRALTQEKELALLKLLDYSRLSKNQLAKRFKIAHRTIIRIQRRYHWMPGYPKGRAGDSFRDYVKRVSPVNECALAIRRIKN